MFTTLLLSISLLGQTAPVAVAAAAPAPAPVQAPVAGVEGFNVAPRAIIAQPAQPAPVAQTTNAFCVTAEGPNAEGLRPLSTKERAKLGFTIRNIRKTTKSLLDAGVITEDMSRAEISAAVFSEIMAQNQQADIQAVESVGAVNWDAILAFIQMLLPLILQLIALFG